MLPSPNAGRIARLAFLAAAPLAAGACDVSTDPVDIRQDFGFVYLSAVQTDAETYGVSARGEFFRASLTAIPNSTAPSDECTEVALPFDLTIPGAIDLPAGEAVTITHDGGVESLGRTSTSPLPTYRPAGNATLPIAPGDSVTVTVPGTTEGFPAVTLRAKTAEPFTFGPVTPPAVVGDPIALTWSAATLAGSAMIVELRYATAGQTNFNIEVRCFFRDDGAATVPGLFATRWAATTNTRRDVQATRLRTTILSSGTQFFDVVSTFQVPTPTTP